LARTNNNLLFLESTLPSLFSGLKNKDIANDCSKILQSLAWHRSELFKENNIPPLIEGLKNKDIANECAFALTFLSETKSFARAQLLLSFDALSEDAKKTLLEANLTKFMLQNADRLNKEFNITYFTRYPESVLKDMLDGKRNFQKPLAVVAYPKSDHKGAFYNNKIDQLSAAGYQVVVFES